MRCEIVRYHGRVLSQRLKPYLTRSAIACLCFAVPAWGQLSVTYLGDVSVSSPITDQFTASFAVAGLSGVCALGGDRYAAVMDNSDKVVLFDLPIAADGTIGSMANMQGLSLAFSGDHEGIARTATGSLLIADENTMTIREANASTGLSIGLTALPGVYTNRRPNRGIESLSYDDGVVWTANEEALTVDGAIATPSTGTVVRLRSQDHATGTEIGQWAYLVEPMHGASIPGGNSGQSGLSELVALPGGSLLAVERSLALANPLFLTRIYSVDIAGATDVAGLPSLMGASITPVSKTLVYQGTHANLEGLCLGPSLNDGGRALLGVVDDGDPISENTVVVFRLDGLDAPGPCLGDIADDFGSPGADGMISFGDFLALLGLIGPCPGGQPSCLGDIADDFGSLGADGMVSFGDFLALLGLIGPCS